MNRPNVLYLHSHDTGRRIAPYGFPVDTPNLSQLADEGVLFRNAFCAAPTCSPSRAALLTGQSAHGAGMIGLNHRGFTLAHPRRHLAAFLQDHGYDTALAGVNHVAADVAEVGYGGVVPTDSGHARDVAPAAAAWLRRKPARPFFLDVGFVETHRGRFVTPEDLDPRDRPDRQQPPAGLPDVPETRLDAARFATAVRAFDEGVGTVLGALRDAGLEGDTVVVCTTDHGVSFPGYKCALNDGGLGVMLLMRGPADFLRGGATADGLVSQIDVYPTLCELLDLPRPGWLEGNSLVPLLRDGAEVNDAVFGEVTYHATYEPMRCVRTPRWAYVRRFGDRLRPTPSNADDGPSKDVVAAAGGFDRPHPRERLHDLHLDPCERENLIDDPAHAEAAAALRGRLEEWMAATDDPLLRGPVPLPAGAVANAPDDFSPKNPTNWGGPA